MSGEGAKIVGLAELRSSATRRPIMSLAFAVVLGALMMAGPASAARSSLVLGRSMDGVRLGDSVARLHRILGEPKAVRQVHGEIVGTEQIDIYGRLSFGSFPAPGSEGEIFSMQTTRRSIRTASGIGVGTRKRRLEREFPSMSCYGHICGVVVGGGLQTIGKRVTDFRMHRGRVKVVSIGRVID